MSAGRTKKPDASLRPIDAEEPHDEAFNLSDNLSATATSTGRRIDRARESNTEASWMNELGNMTRTLRAQVAARRRSTREGALCCRTRRVR
jgi:hypothetical protein